MGDLLESERLYIEDDIITIYDKDQNERVELSKKEILEIYNLVFPDKST